MPEGKVRVDELARTLGVSSAQLITLLGDLGVKAAGPTALVDASLEDRLKGLIRRPTLGGRGMMAVRPEPTWLTSLQRPRRRGVEPPKPAPEGEARESVLKKEKPGASEMRAAEARPTEKEETREPEAGQTGARVEPREEPRPWPAERVRGRTLPSGRTPTPPPPPPTSGRARGRAAARQAGVRPSPPRPAQSPGPRPAADRGRRRAEEGRPTQTGVRRARPAQRGAAAARPAPARRLGAEIVPPPAAVAKPERKGAPGQKRGPAGRQRGPREGPAGRRWRDEDVALGKGRRGKGRKGGPEPARPSEPPRVPATEVVVEGPVTVRELAERMGVTGAELIKSLIRLGIVAGLNQVLDPETVRVALTEMGLVVHTSKPEEGDEAVRDESARAEWEEPDQDALQPRPPVVTVMGHVDHGKTSLLDAIRKTNVTAGEAGGITQHIGASTVEWKGKRLVFLDTPGHEAFTAMRARGARVTDIAVLVVAADDGVMPQTVEAINHARAAKVPIIVALNKIDKPNALPDRVKKQLGEHGLTPEEWGGETIVVPVSAKEGTGIDDLLEMILLVAEMSDLKANPNRRARGTVIETRLDKGLGPVASVLVQTGTLRIGDPFVVGSCSGRVRAMVGDKGQRLQEAGPSTPVEVVGLDDLPEAGDLLEVLADEKMAREIAAHRDERRREQELGVRATVTLSDLLDQVSEGQRRQLNLVLKADVQGSLEAVKQSLRKLEEPEVGIEVIHAGVGGVTETDVMLASASEAMIIAFNVTPDSGARQAAERENVEIRTYRVIYDAINDIKAAVKGLRAPQFKETVLGHAEVRELFRIPKVGVVAGCHVTDGKITRKSQVRVVRDGKIVYEGKIASLKHFKEDQREISAGFDCGIGLEDFQDVKVGDVIEAFIVEEVPA